MGSEGKRISIVFRTWPVLWGCIIFNSQQWYMRECFPSHAKNMMSIWNLVNKTNVLYYNSILCFSSAREMEHLFPCLRVVCTIAPVSAYCVHVLTSQQAGETGGNGGWRILFKNMTHKSYRITFTFSWLSEKVGNEISRWVTMSPIKTWTGAKCSITQRHKGWVGTGNSSFCLILRGTHVSSLSAFLNIFPLIGLLAVSPKKQASSLCSYQLFSLAWSILLPESMAHPLTRLLRSEALLNIGNDEHPPLLSFAFPLRT